MTYRLPTTSTTITAVAGLAALTASTCAPAAAAVAPAPTTVTIRADGTDLSGKVSSTRAVCRSDRLVVVIKQVGARGGGNDVRFAEDTSDSDGDWSTGNTGTEGRFYAKVRKNAQCRGDASPTIRATR